MEANCYNQEVSGKNDYHKNGSSRSFCGRSMNAPTSGGRFRFCHFLDSCFLCKKPLGNNIDIFMYRGDMPFCSVECREEHMEEDEAKAKKWSISSSVETLRSKEQKKKALSLPNKSGDRTVRTGSIAA